MIFSITIWFLLNEVFHQFSNKQRARNYVSFVHSLLCIYKIYTDEYMNLPITSISYFMYDIIYILLNYSKAEKLYLYHHIICISFLLEFQQLNEYDLYYIYGIGELSNFFTYIVYDMIKMGISKIIVDKIKYIQLLWFSFFRVLCFTYFIYSKSESYLKLKYHSQIGGLTIYCLGLGWSFNQLRLLI